MMKSKNRFVFLLFPFLLSSCGFRKACNVPAKFEKEAAVEGKIQLIQDGSNQEFVFVSTDSNKKIVGVFDEGTGYLKDDPTRLYSDEDSSFYSSSSCDQDGYSEFYTELKKEFLQVDKTVYADLCLPYNSSSEMNEDCFVIEKLDPLKGYEDYQTFYLMNLYLTKKDSDFYSKANYVDFWRHTVKSCPDKKSD